MLPYNIYQIHATLQLSGAVNTLLLTIVIVPRHLNCSSIGDTTIVRVTNFVGFFLRKSSLHSPELFAVQLLNLVLTELNKSFLLHFLLLVTLFHLVTSIWNKLYLCFVSLHRIILTCNFNFQFLQLETKI